MDERDYLLNDLWQAQKALRDCTNLARQVPQTAVGRAYRQALEQDVARLEKELAELERKDVA